jgi:hypothetical protein
MEGLSPKYLAAERHLGEPLAAWMRRHRDAGESWRDLSFELHRLTGVRVSDVTLARWSEETGHSVSYQVDPLELLGDQQV